MKLTLFLPIFLAMAIYAMTGVRRWAWMIGFSAFFQAASPIVIAGGGRYVGIAPVYCLMFIGLWHVYGSYYNRGLAGRDAPARPPGSTAAPLLLGLFVLIGVTGAVFLPRLLQGMVQVLPPRAGMESGFTVPLGPSTTNYIQSFYLACILGLFLMVRHVTIKKSVPPQCFLDGIVAGTLLAVFLGYYQLAAYRFGLPWPAEVVNSNAGIAQLQDQTTFGMKRISSLFMEPSTMSQHMLAGIGVLVFGFQRKLLGLLALGVLLLSTSSMAYFGLLALSAIWLLASRYQRPGGKWSLVALVAAILALAVAVDAFFMSGQVTKGLLLEKLESGSGRARMNADALAAASFVQSFGLGSGVGSARASSLPASLAATVGLPGLLVFAAFLWSVFACVRKQRNDQERAILFGMLGLLIAWLLAAPDINIALFWILAGLASSTAPPPTRKDEPAPSMPPGRRQEVNA